MGVRGAVVGITSAGLLCGAVAGCMSTTGSASGSAVTRTVTVTRVVTSIPPAPAQSPNSSSSPALPDAAVAHALQLLAQLPVKGRAPKTGYDRKEFGTRWSDDVSVQLGHNGCDTRNDILRRDLTDVTLKPNTHGCVVLTGVLVDPYTRTRISFRRGVGTSNAIQIDHVVALSDAWQKGAQQLTAEQWQDFANDPRNLLAVSGSANASKRDGDAATWLPKNKAYRCTYVAKQVTVKADYHLWVTKAEQEAMDRILRKCG
ncbi:HNH endonuclease family protein [Flexivirga lutea]